MSIGGRTVFTCLLAAACLVAPAATAHGEQAETADEQQPQPAPPESVKVQGNLPYVPTINTITTRLPLALRLTPANVGTVGEVVLQEQHALVLGDALRNVSGLNAQTVSDVVDFFVLRGFDSLSSVMVLTDGAPEPEVTFFQMYNVDRVEVFKGPAGFLYGRNPLTGALAGAVNIVRRQPQAGTFGRAGVSAGSFGTYDGTVDYNASTRDGGIGFRLNSTWRQSDFYRDDKGNDNLAVNPAFTWRIGTDSSLNVNLELVDTRYEPDAGLPIFNGTVAPVPRTRSYQSPFDKSDQQLGRAQIDFETRLSDSWTFKNKAFQRSLDWKSDGTLFAGVFPSFTTGRPEVNRFLTRLDDNQQFIGDQAEAVLSASTGSVKHELLTGLEFARFGDDFTLDVASLPAIDLFAPVETASRPLASIPGQSSAGDSRSLVVAPYVIDQVAFSERLHALAGLRLDRIDFEDRVTNVSRVDGEVSPMAGVIYAPTPSLSFYANAGRSFGPPPSRVPGKPDPEEGAQVEVGAKLNRLAGKLQATIAAYDLKRDNIAIPDDNGFTQQAGDQRSRGIELELAAELMPRLRTFISYAYNDAELTRFAERLQVGVDPNFNPVFATFDRSGNTPAFAPRHLANLWVSKQFGNGFGVAGGGRYVSEQFIAEDNAVTIGGYVVLDGAVSYTRGDWELHLNLKNLTGREYETRGFGSTSVIPAPPFAAYGGVQYRF